MDTRKITIEPVTRIEGHARVTIELDDAGEVSRTYLHVDEFRGLEKFSENRPYFEMPQITQRICGICPVSHHLASAKACDAVLGVDPPRPAHLLRELMHMGQFVQSHGMHFFYLAGPDLLFGFDADPAVRNVFGIVEANPALAKKAIGLRRFGQQVIESLGGKRVHPNFAVPGGVNNGLGTADRDRIAAELEDHIAVAEEALAILEGWLAENSQVAAGFASFPSNYLALADSRGQLQLYDGSLRLIDHGGEPMATFGAADYLDHIAEHVASWSFLKFPYHRPQGWPEGSYRVGPLARMNVADSVGTPRAQAELDKFKQRAGHRPAEGSLLYHHARLIELVYALERIGTLLADPDILSTDLRDYREVPRNRRGIGVIEAPRGTLIHDYTIDKHGLLERVNLIVATGHNNWAMNQAVESVAKTYVRGSAVTEGNLNRVEAAVRCYDPCFSCSTHAVGKMPLVVEIKNRDGTSIGCFRR